jgi:hypothetical protein
MIRSCAQAHRPTSIGGLTRLRFIIAITVKVKIYRISCQQEWGISEWSIESIKEELRFLCSSPLREWSWWVAVPENAASMWVWRATAEHMHTINFSLPDTRFMWFKRDFSRYSKTHCSQRVRVYWNPHKIIPGRYCFLICWGRHLNPLWSSSSYWFVLIHVIASVLKLWASSWHCIRKISRIWHVIAVLICKRYSLAVIAQRNE